MGPDQFSAFATSESVFIGVEEFRIKKCLAKIKTPTRCGHLAVGRNDEQQDMPNLAARVLMKAVFAAKWYANANEDNLFIQQRGARAISPDLDSCMCTHSSAD